MKRLTVDELNLEGQPGAFAGTLMNSSADLVTRVCQGDSDAFRLIFERYSRPVISFIFDMVNDRGLAEELTQETFVRAYRAIRTMRKDTKLSTWLFGIARNVRACGSTFNLDRRRSSSTRDTRGTSRSSNGPARN